MSISNCDQCSEVIDTDEELESINEKPVCDSCYGEYVQALQKEFALEKERYLMELRKDDDN